MLEHREIAQSDLGQRRRFTSAIIERMKLRLSDPAMMADLGAYLGDRGFLVVVRGRYELDTHLLNHVNDRYDRARAHEALRDWRDRHPWVAVEEIG